MFYSVAGVAIRTFAQVLSLLRSELPNLSDTSKPVSLVSRTKFTHHAKCPTGRQPRASVLSAGLSGVKRGIRELFQLYIGFQHC